MYDVVAMGELLIDFAPMGTGKMGNPAFESNPGGAPVNCVTALTRLGGKSAFIGAVGRDFFGGFIVDTLKKTGVGTAGIRAIEGVPTTLAFVYIDANGERSFSFVRKPGADIMLQKDDIPYDIIDKARVFHFGSISLTDEPAREATFACVRYAREKGKIISYDPNYRESLWPDKDTAVKYMSEGLKYADRVKMSEVEMELLTGIPEADADKGAKEILGTGKTAVYITLGAKGAYYATGKGAGFVPGFNVKAVDTTGCGDAFTGAVLYQLCHEPDKTDAEMVKFANATGAICATRFGGIPAMPSYAEVSEFLSQK